MGDAHGETDLGRLLAALDPVLRDGEYVFASVPSGRSLVGLDPVLVFTEDEGLTLILPRARSDAAGLAATYPSAWITLGVHSSLDAVGMLAPIAAALAAAGISCNVVSAFHHDHLFVPHDRGSDAVGVIHGLVEAAGNRA